MDIQNLPTKPKIDKKNILILFLAILNLFLISYVLLVRSLPSTKIQPITTLPSPSQPADPTSTWQTYKNEKYGFEFKYPAELIYKPYSGNINDDGGDSIQSIDFRTKQLELGRETISGIGYRISISDFACELFDRTKTTIDPAISDIEDITIDSLPAKLYHFSWDGTESEVTQIPYNYNNSCIYISVSYGPNYQPLWENQYNQILSTFKFSDPTSIWQTYNNTDFGFEVKYPSTVQIENQIFDSNNKFIKFADDQIDFEVRIKQDSENTNLSDYIFLDYPIKSQTTISGQKANVYESSTGYCDGPGCGLPFVSIVTKKNSNFYHISFYGDSLLSDLENQILSTFKFTN